jgi:hypothetical protein
MPVIESFDAIVIGSGQAGGPLASAFATAGRLPYTVLRDAVFAHPTLAESLNNLFATLDDRTVATTQHVETEMQSMEADSASMSAAEARSRTLYDKSRGEKR